MRITIPAIAALAVGGLLLSTRSRKANAPLARSNMHSNLHRSRMPRVEFTTQEDAPRLSRHETLVVRRPGIGTMATLTALTAGGILAWNQMRQRGSRSASSVRESIVLNVPVSTAYNQWTQFEEFPRFMESVQEVRQLDDTHLHWRAEVAGKTKEWDAEITEQIPDERIAWRSTGGVTNSGVVTFHRAGDNMTKIVLQMDYDPQTLSEKVGDAVGAVKLTAKGNLKRFKQLVEARGVETGGWRKTVEAQR